MNRVLGKIAHATSLHRSALARTPLSTILVALALGFCSAPAFAQGCAMCYATAKATPQDGQRALNRAILVMVVPPIGAITLGVGAAIRYSRKRDDEKNDHEA